MEYMESKMQDQIEGSLQNEAFKQGMLRAVEILRRGASDHDVLATQSVTIAAAEGYRFAAVMLRSWANGIEIRAENGG